MERKRPGWRTPAPIRVLEIARHAALQEGRIGQPFGAGLDHGHRHLGLAHHRFPFLGRPGSRRFRDQIDKPLPPRGAQARTLVDVVAGVVLHVRRLADHPLRDDLVVDTEDLEEGAVLVDVVGRADEENAPIRAFVEVDRRIGMAPHVLRDLCDVIVGQVAAEVAERREDEVQHRVVDRREVVARGLPLDPAREQGHGGHHAVGERHLDVLAAAGALPVVEPEGRGEGSEHSAVGRRHGDSGVRGSAEQRAEGADVRIDADGGVDDPFPGRDVPLRITFRKARQGDVDQAPAPAIERAVVEPESGGGARTHVLQHDVGLGGPIAACAPRCLVLEVDPEQAFAAIQQRVGSVGFTAGPDDLDYVRPLVREQHRGYPAGPASAEIEHANPRERRRPFWCMSLHVRPPPADSAGPRRGGEPSAATGTGADCSRGDPAVIGRSRRGAGALGGWRDPRGWTGRGRGKATRPARAGRGLGGGRNPRGRGRSAHARLRHADEAVPRDER